LIKILHTSDWHLGKKLYRYSRIEEQRLILNWFIQELAQNNIDILVIAGDIFDVPTPPNDAHKLYYEFLNQAQKHCQKIIITSGNHDSGDFLKASSPIIKEKNIYVFDKLHSKREDNYITFKLNGKDVSICNLPYFRNVELHRYYQENMAEAEKDEDWKLNVLSDLFNNVPDADFKLAVAHHAFGDYSATGSEHTLSLSGLEKLSTDIFEAYDYVALGHIHQMQKIKGPCPIYYSGSPLPLRFSESAKKYYNLLVFDKSLEIERKEIPNFRKIVQIKTDSENYIDELKTQLEKIESQLKPYIEVKITMHESLTGMADMIKGLCDKYDCELLNIMALLGHNDDEDDENQINIHELSHLEIFEEFYKEKYPERKIPKHLKEKFKLILEEINNEGA
jgi:exonuclease SbcD